MFFILPYGNDRRTVRFPSVTYALIAANVLAFVWLRLMPYKYDDILMSMGLVPSSPSVPNILSSMFVHANELHLAFNMLFLWLFGPNVEDALGGLEYAIFYFGSGFAAAFMHVAVMHAFAYPSVPAVYGAAISPADIPMVGASGAIAGVLGVFAVRFYKTRIRVWYLVYLLFIGRWGKFCVPAWIGLGIWFLQQFVGGIFGILDPTSGGVAYWSHIGGMLFGMLLAYALRMGLEGTKEYLLSDARTSLAQGTTWDAAENLLALLKRDPGNADVHRELANTYTIQQNPEQAITHYRRSIDLHLRKGQREKAIEDLVELKQHYPNARLSLRSEYQLARYLLEIRNHVPALLLLEGIADAHPTTPEAEMALMKIGDIYLNVLDNPRSAQAFYERFLDEYPHSGYRATVERSLSAAREKL